MTDRGDSLVSAADQDANFFIAILITVIINHIQLAIFRFKFMYLDLGLIVIDVGVANGKLIITVTRRQIAGALKTLSWSQGIKSIIHSYFTTAW